MKLKLYFLFVLMLTLSYSIFAQEYEWFRKIKSIIVISSTREDVIKVFGQPKDVTRKYNVSYNLTEGKMDVEYSTGLCGLNKKKGWNVPEFTVTRIFFFPSKPFIPKELGVDLTEFRKYEVSDVPGSFEYENEEIGIDYSVTTKGKIEGIEFYPPSKYDYLYCKE